MYLFIFFFNTLYGCAGEVSAEAASETLAYPFTDAKIVVLWETAKKDGQKKWRQAPFL
jgi:hypothetical protein